MRPTKIFAMAERILRQLSHDHRTLGLLFFVPPILITVLRFTFQGSIGVFNSIAPMMLGIFPLIMMFLITSIGTLRERTTGTLDRLMTMPISKSEIIFGYAAAFSFIATIQALIASFVILVLLDVPVAGGALAVIVCAVISGFLGTAAGLFTSAFAASEFQAVQFMPAFIFPQLLTCGLFVARENMARPLQWFADVMPLTYSVDAMKQITMHRSWTADLKRDLVVVGVFGVVALFLAAATIRRQD